MSGRLSLTYKYQKSDTTITIFTDKISKSDKDWLTRFGYSFFYNSNIKLTIIKGGYLDFDNSLIYVEQEKSRGNYKLAYIIEGKTYIQDMGQTDGYGLVKKKPKRNRRLEKRLKQIADNPDKFNLEFLKGLRAYQKVGLRYVAGVIIIDRNKTTAYIGLANMPGRLKNNRLHIATQLQFRLMNNAGQQNKQ